MNGSLINPEKPIYDFLKRISTIRDSHQSRSIILTGNTNDLFFVALEESTVAYMPLTNFLMARWSLPKEGSTGGKEGPNIIVVVYELNGSIRFARKEDRDKVMTAWNRFMAGKEGEEDSVPSDFDKKLKEIIGRPALALKFLEQLCLCSRSAVGGKPLLSGNLMIIIEHAEFLIPEGEVARLSDADRHRIMTCCKWFSDPRFMAGGDTVILVTETKSSLNHEVIALPSVVEVEMPLPNEGVRRHFLSNFRATHPEGSSLELWGADQDLIQVSEGLSVYALSQLLNGVVYERRRLEPGDVIAEVEKNIKRLLGDEVVEFKRPRHRLKDVVGYRGLKVFLQEEVIPRIRSTGGDALPAAIACGPLGVGKTFIMEAVAAESGAPILLLKGLRSKWYGDTDTLVALLRRVIEVFSRLIILVDEADTEFGGVGPEELSVERRLTGKIQSMMADPELRGRVCWVLMTARIHLLSRDILREGRAGDMVIPILDPEGEDRLEFVRWALASALGEVLADPKSDVAAMFDKAITGKSPASFASLRSEIEAKAKTKGPLDVAAVMKIVENRIPPSIDETREYQTLQALCHCTHRQLLPPVKNLAEQKKEWRRRIAELERMGVS